jgi:hypothetical protein
MSISSERDCGSQSTETGAYYHDIQGFQVGVLHCVGWLRSNWMDVLFALLN